MIASLPMYDRASNREAWDAFWSLVRDSLRDHGIGAPDSLDRSVLYRDSWARPDLVLGQICVMPLQQSFRDQVTLIAAGNFGVAGCAPGFFNSVMVCRKDDPRESLQDFASTRFVANAKHSYSGYFAPDALARRLGLTLPEPKITASHDESLRAIVRGESDFAAIDAHTWHLQQQDMSEPSKLRVFASTSAAPGQSFITKTGEDASPYRSAISQAISTLSSDAKAVTGLRGIVTVPLLDYDAAVPLGKVPANAI